MLFSCVEIWLKCTAVKPSLRNACKSKSDSSGVCSARLVIVLSCFIASRACRWLVQSELEYLMKMEGAQSKTPKGRKGRGCLCLAKTRHKLSWRGPLLLLLYYHCTCLPFYHHSRLGTVPHSYSNYPQHALSQPDSVLNHSQNLEECNL
jgi:hypothetical protein